MEDRWAGGERFPRGGERRSLRGDRLSAGDRPRWGERESSLLPRPRRTLGERDLVGLRREPEVRLRDEYDDERLGEGEGDRAGMLPDNAPLLASPLA